VIKPHCGIRAMTEHKPRVDDDSDKTHWSRVVNPTVKKSYSWSSSFTATHGLKVLGGISAELDKFRVPTNLVVRRVAQERNISTGWATV
jgi:hypothetical protein